MKTMMSGLKRAKAGTVLSMAAIFAFIGTFIATTSTIQSPIFLAEQPKVPKCLIKE